MLKATEEFHKTDTGRQRRANEDALFVQTPLFVVADGMGGAQSGEVASSLVVETFQEGLISEQSPEEALSERITQANLRINQLAAEDPRHAGMGTTVTAAYLGDTELSIAHVGDSRAYRLREGELERLTQDHSLVGELVQRGKLTEEEAEEHPQRSIITRALGPEASVEIDTATYRVNNGDLFLLCSDGLTSMLNDAAIAVTLNQATSIAQAGQSLIDQANAAGGRDNITLILFRAQEIEGASPDAGVTEVSLPLVTDEQVREAVREVAVEEIDSTGSSLDEHIDEEIPEVTKTKPQRRGGLRRVTKVLLVCLVLLTPLLAGGWVASRALYFIGADSQGFVTVYRGVPYQLPFGVDLYETYYVSGISTKQISKRRQNTLLDHRLRSKDDASDLIYQLELGQVRN